MDWMPNVAVTGYWFTPGDPGWKPPLELQTFLGDGPPPIYIGFGSMPERRPDDLADIVVRALRRARLRGVLGAGWANLEAYGGNGPEVQIVADPPHQWLFPRVSAVVHHGGAGTTHTGLRAGRPTVIVPFLTDQPFWGRRVVATGVGPEPIPRRHLSVEALAAAIHRAVTDPGVLTRAARMGTRIEREDGVAQAVDHFERAVSRG
jgi:UDP:flavonoid glycosyltransferase YjiC (YdhE family)